ncbi:hypothetical protein [Zoogloea sp.]|uniref:hypothetical protein n=1 Tax=Zoogloea sp. TaxID=49181 RepID=UPI001A5B896F|nr:hypothetical protein [Zoogloeaceae bacterium]
MKILYRLVAWALVTGLSASALAGLRAIPPEAPAAVMTMLADGRVALGKRVFTISPAGQIRDANNRIVLPATLGGSYVVRVLLAPDGQLYRAWILTAEEAAQPAPKF